MKGQTYVISGIVVLIIISIFAVINVEPVKVNYLFWSGESPLILVILFSVLMGGVITAAASSFRFFHLKKEKKQMKAILEEHDLLPYYEAKMAEKDEEAGK